MTFYPPLLHLHHIASTVRIAVAVILAVTPFCIQAEPSANGNSKDQHQFAPSAPDYVNRVLRQECLRQGTSWIGCSRMAGTAYLFLKTFGDAAWDQEISEAISNQVDSDAQSTIKATMNDASGGSTASQRAVLAAKEAAHFYWAAFTADPAVTDEILDPSIALDIAEEETGVLATKLKALGVGHKWAELVGKTIANQPDLGFEFIPSPAGTNIFIDQPAINPVLDKLQKAQVAKWPEPEFFEIRRGYSPTTPELVKNYGKL